MLHSPLPEGEGDRECVQGALCPSSCRSLFAYSVLDVRGGGAASNNLLEEPSPNGECLFFFIAADENLSLKVLQKQEDTALQTSVK